jgi:hypothetical protein
MFGVCKVKRQVRLVLPVVSVMQLTLSSQWTCCLLPHPALPLPAKLCGLAGSSPTEGRDEKHNAKATVLAATSIQNKHTYMQHLLDQRFTPSSKQDEHWRCGIRLQQFDVCNIQVAVAFERAHDAVLFEPFSRFCQALSDGTPRHDFFDGLSGRHVGWPRPAVGAALNCLGQNV